MRIVIAPDKFKGSLTATEVARALGEGLRDALPTIGLDVVPVADGGEGTVDAALGGGFERHSTIVSGPLGAPIEAVWALRDDIAVIEMATASGLELLPEAERDALRATSRGTGELVRAALDAGARELVLAIGGSASTDGGAGMLAALGAKLLDADGNEVADGGGALVDVATVDLDALDPRLADASVVLASDVDHVLLGTAGAAAVFGPQKGASADDVVALDRGLTAFADALDAAVGHSGDSHRSHPGAGAAGGVGYGALAALGATRRPGVEVVVGFTELAERMAGADLAITGEGSFDEQSLGGKTPMGVVAVARAHGVPAVAVCGRSLLDPAQWGDAGFDACYATSDRAPDAETSIREAARLLRAIGHDIAKAHLGAAVSTTAGATPGVDTSDDGTPGAASTVPETAVPDSRSAG